MTKYVFSLVSRPNIIIFKITALFYLKRMYEVCTLHSDMGSGAVNFPLQKDPNKQLEIFLTDRETRQVLWTGFKYANSDRNRKHEEISLSAELIWIIQVPSWSSKSF